MPNMQLLKVAFSAIFSTLPYQAAQPKNSLFSPPLYEAAKPTIVIPSYTAQRKSVSLRSQSFMCKTMQTRCQQAQTSPPSCCRCWGDHFWVAGSPSI